LRHRITGQTLTVGFLVASSLPAFVSALVAVAHLHVSRNTVSLLWSSAVEFAQGLGADVNVSATGDAAPDTSE
jgi:hypothetical protein